MTRPAARKARARSVGDDVAHAVTCVRRLVRTLRVAEQQTRAHTGLSAAQLLVLSQLRDDGDASLNELAARTLTDRTSVRAVVERLEAEGLVRSGRDAADRRRVAVTLTASGARRLRSAPPAPGARLFAALRSLPRARVKALNASLGALIVAMGGDQQRATMLFSEEGEPRRVTRRRA